MIEPSRDLLIDQVKPVVALRFQPTNTQRSPGCDVCGDHLSLSAFCSLRSRGEADEGSSAQPLPISVERRRARISARVSVCSSTASRAAAAAARAGLARRPAGLQPFELTLYLKPPLGLFAVHGAIPRCKLKIQGADEEHASRPVGCALPSATDGPQNGGVTGAIGKT